MQATEHAEQDAMVRQSRDQLDTERWAIFTPKVESGLSYQEITETLNIPEGTVGSRLNRARRDLIDGNWEQHSPGFTPDSFTSQ